MSFMETYDDDYVADLEGTTFPLRTKAGMNPNPFPMQTTQMMSERNPIEDSGICDPDEECCR